MFAYERFTVATDEPVGGPGNLPDVFGGNSTRLAAEDLARLGDLLAEQQSPLAEEYAGQGYRLIEVDDPPPPVPQAVTQLQFRRALRYAGIYSQVMAFVAQQDEETVEAFDFASEFRRDSPLLNAAAGALYPGTADEQLDGLFSYAATVIE